MSDNLVQVGSLFAEKTGSVNPANYPEEVFDLYSIPAFDSGEPEIAAGADIGSSKKVVQTGDVLLSRIVPHIRRAWVVGKSQGRRLIASGEWIIFRDEKIWPDYLKHVLVGDPFHAMFMNTVAGVGGSLLRARPEYVKRIKISLPSLEEQKRIAEVLDRAEALRARRRAALALLDELTQSIFLDMFGDPVLNPKNWPVGKIGDLDLKIADGNYSAKYPKNSEFVENGVPFIRANNMDNMTIDADDMRFISAEKHAELRKGHLETEDVLLTTRGEIGKVAIVPEVFAGANINAQIVLLRPESDQFDRLFLAHQLAIPQMKRLIQSYQNGVALKQLPIRQVVRIPLCVPDRASQTEFARRVASASTLVHRHQSHLSALDSLFASLQSRAFKGELFGCSREPVAADAD